MEKLSILLPTYNNEATVRSCLDALRFADEILVVDSFSRDKTLNICREYGRIIQHEYIQSAKQKNWAIPQCANQWVFQLDIDEMPEPALIDEIKSVLVHPPAQVDGYRMPFKHHVLAEWVRSAGLYPEYHLRLFRRDRGRFEDKEVHARVRVPGQVETLRNHIMHNGMTSISQQLRNVDRYSRYQADELKKLDIRFAWHQLVLRPFAVFAYYYFWKKGFTAGYRGFLVSAINANFDFWSYAKLWEMQKFHLPSSPK